MRKDLFNKRWLSGETVAEANLPNGMKVYIEPTVGHPILVGNVRSAMARTNVSRFHDFEHNDTSGPIAIVGGGPTVRNFVDEIKTFESIMVLSSAHDWAKQNAIPFNYCVFYDPDARMAQFSHLADHVPLYLTASTCAPQLFDRLLAKGGRPSLWHPAGDVSPAVCENEPQVGGGSTVMLRAIPIAIILGFTDLHLFGFDSCFVGQADHAYELASAELRSEADANEISVSVNDREFRTTVGWLAQAQQFIKMKKARGKDFNAFIYGDNLTAALVANEKNLR